MASTALANTSDNPVGPDKSRRFRTDVVHVCPKTFRKLMRKPAEVSSGRSGGSRHQGSVEYGSDSAKLRFLFLCIISVQKKPLHRLAWFNCKSRNLVFTGIQNKECAYYTFILNSDSNYEMSINVSKLARKVGSIGEFRAKLRATVSRCYAAHSKAFKPCRESFARSLAREEERPGLGFGPSDQRPISYDAMRAAVAEAYSAMRTEVRCLRKWYPEDMKGFPESRKPLIGAIVRKGTPYETPYDRVLFPVKPKAKVDDLRRFANAVIPFYNYEYPVPINDAERDLFAKVASGSTFIMPPLDSPAYDILPDSYKAMPHWTYPVLGSNRYQWYALSKVRELKNSLL